MNKLITYTEWFLVYCVTGWLYESIWCAMIDENGGFINRGFLYGPWLPIYGFSMLVIMWVIWRLKIKRPFLIFLTGAVMSTTAELIGSYFMDWLCGGFLWNYSSFFMNFQGRIALKPAIMFGLLILGGVLVIHPKMTALQEKFKDSIIHKILFFIVALAFAADLVISLAVKA